MSQIDTFLSSHLDLQVKLSFKDHHEFLLKHNLNSSTKILDIGTGNGQFAATLASVHPNIFFLGLDKRAQYIEMCKKIETTNFKAKQLDLFSLDNTIDFDEFDGIIMRYFLLHIDHTEKLLKNLGQKLRTGTKLWIIDLDWSQNMCSPSHPAFDKFTDLIRDFCKKISKDSQGAQNIVPILKKLNFNKIEIEKKPFTSTKENKLELATYLKQEAICYAKMMGLKESNTELTSIIDFFDEEILKHDYAIYYGMNLIYAEF